MRACYIAVELICWRLHSSSALRKHQAFGGPTHLTLISTVHQALGGLGKPASEPVVERTPAVLTGDQCTAILWCAWIAAGREKFVKVL